MKLRRLPSLPYIQAQFIQKTNYSSKQQNKARLAINLETMLHQEHQLTRGYSQILSPKIFLKYALTEDLTLLPRTQMSCYYSTLNTKKRFFIQRVFGHWNKLSRAAVTGREFKKCLDKDRRHMVGFLGHRSWTLMILVDPCDPFQLRISCDQLPWEILS